jgi:hypothetical protein
MQLATGICAHHVDATRIAQSEALTKEPSRTGWEIKFVNEPEQGRIEPNTRCMIRWRTKHGFRIHSVSIEVWDTSQTMQGNMVVAAKNVANTGSYDWLVPSSLTSPGPYIIGVYFVKSIKPPTGALGAGKIFRLEQPVLHLLTSPPATNKVRSGGNVGRTKFVASSHSEPTGASAHSRIPFQIA